MVEALRPAPPPEPVRPAATADFERDEFADRAALGGSRSWSDVPPLDIPIADLDYEKRDGWTNDQWIRAERSGFLIWSANQGAKEAAPWPVAPATAAFMRKRAWVATRRSMAEAGDAAVPVGDLHPDRMISWDDEQWERAESSGLLQRLPEEVWVEESEPDSGAPCQSSTSSTFPSGGEDEGG